MSRNRDISSAKTLVYYLGSKQRMAAYLAQVVAEITHGQGPVLDLFCGMGSASLELAKTCPVTSVDVQEYARVVCSALLADARMDRGEVSHFRTRFRHYAKELSTIYDSLLEGERVATQEFLHGKPELLSDIIEHGCLLKEYRNDRPEWLERVVVACEENRAKCRNPPYDAVVRYFGGTYFSYSQALQLAAARSAVKDLPEKVGDIALAAVLSAASHCASTVGGQFAQPLKTVDSSGSIKGAVLEKALRVRRVEVWRQIEAALGVIEQSAVRSQSNQVMKAECLEYLCNQPRDAFAAIYADPPYSRYHYSRYYHVLETIALGDEPSVTMNPATKRPSRGVYRSGRYQSPYSTRRGAKEAFEKLLKMTVDKSPALVLSYSPYPESKRSTPRMVTIGQLEDMARQYYGSVESHTVSWVSHSKLNAAGLELEASEESEVLLVCRR